MSVPVWGDLLAKDETILWQGQPDARILWRDIFGPKTAFGALFTVFVVFWICVAQWISAGHPRLGLFPIIGLPFLGIGLYLMVGHILWDAYVRGQSHYALTNRRIYFATLILGRRRAQIHNLAEVETMSYEVGSPGTVWFGARGAPTDIGFRRIAQAQEIYQQILALKNALLQE